MLAHGARWYGYVQHLRLVCVTSCDEERDFWRAISADHTASLHVFQDARLEVFEQRLRNCARSP